MMLTLLLIPLQDGRHPLGGAGPVKLLSHALRSLFLLGNGPIGLISLRYSLGDAVDVRGVDHEGFTFARLEHPRRTRSDNWGAAGHGFQRWRTKSLQQGSVNEYARRAIQT